MNALELLRNDHRRILNLFQEVESQIDTATNSETFDQLGHAIHFHERMLDEVLYPELEDHKNIHAFISMQAEIDRQIDSLLESIRQSNPPGQDRSRELNELKTRWLEHMERAEARLFPEAEKLLGAGKLLELSYEMDEIRTHQSDQDSAIYPARRLGPRE
jgi:hemerythrin